MPQAKVMHDSGRAGYCFNRTHTSKDVKHQYESEHDKKSGRDGWPALHARQDRVRPETAQLALAWFGLHEAFHTLTVTALICHFAAALIATYALR